MFRKRKLYNRKELRYLHNELLNIFSHLQDDCADYREDIECQNCMYYHLCSDVRNEIENIDKKERI